MGSLYFEIHILRISSIYGKRAHSEVATAQAVALAMLPVREPSTVGFIVAPIIAPMEALAPVAPTNVFAGPLVTKCPKMLIANPVDEPASKLLPWKKVVMDDIICATNTVILK